MSQSAEIVEFKEVSERVKKARTNLAALKRKAASLEEQLSETKGKIPVAENEARDAEKALDAFIKKGLPTLLKQAGDAKLEIAALISSAMSGEAEVPA